MTPDQIEAIDTALLETELSINKISKASGKRWNVIARRAKLLKVPRKSHKPLKLTQEGHKMLNLIRQQFARPEVDFETDREMKTTDLPKERASISDCPLSDPSDTEQINDALGWK